MTDNIAITPGSGATVRTYDIGSGIQVQAVILADESGDALATVPVSVGSGDIEVTSHVKENLLIHASAARTATPTAVENVNLYHDGVIVVVKVTAITATPSVTPSLRVKDDLGSGDWVTLDTYAALTGVGTTSYYVHPGAHAETGCTDFSGVCLGRVWSILMTHGDADSITYSVGAIYL